MNHSFSARLVILASLCCANVSTADTVRPFLFDSGDYRYLPSPWISTGHDCLWETGCEFDIAGVFTLSVDEAQNEAKVLAADVILSGNENTIDPDRFVGSPIDDEGVSELLKSLELQRQKSAGETLLFRTRHVVFGIDDDSLYIEGGPDLRPADGDGYRFDATAKRTWFGDANMDGEFNSTDFVQVFQSGFYEKNEPATWRTGDWDGDGKFDSSDFVLAFADGGYEQGPVPFTRAVPEPAGFVYVLFGLPLAVACRRCRRVASLR